MHHRTEIILLITLVFLTVSVRLGHIDDHGMWEDEATRYFLSMGNGVIFEKMNNMYKEPIHVNEVKNILGSLRDVFILIKACTPMYAPVYYAIMHLTARWGGITSVVDLRLWNIAFAVLTAVFLWRLARKSLPPGAAFLSVLLFSLSAWDMGVGLQFKEYSCATFLATASSYYLYRITHDPPRVRYTVLYGLTMGLGCLTHAFIFFLMPAHGLYVFIYSRLQRRRCYSLIVGWAIAFVMVAPWTAYILKSQIAEISTFNAGLGPGSIGLLDLVRKTWELVWVSFLPFPAGLGNSVDRCLVALVMAGVIIGGSGLLLQEECEKRGARLGGVVYVGVLIALMGYRVILKQEQVLWPRYHVIFMPMAWLAVGACVHGLLMQVADRIKGTASPVGRRAMIGAWVLFTGMALLLGWAQLRFLSTASNGLDRYLDYRKATSVLKPHVSSNDVIVHVPVSAPFLPFAYYWEMNTTWHTSLERDDPEKVQRVVDIAGDRSIWYVFTWGRRAKLEKAIARQMEEKGYRLGDRVVCYDLCAVRFDRNKS